MNAHVAVPRALWVVHSFLLRTFHRGDLTSHGYLAGHREEKRYRTTAKLWLHNEIGAAEHRETSAIVLRQKSVCTLKGATFPDCNALNCPFPTPHLNA